MKTFLIAALATFVLTASVGCHVGQGAPNPQAKVAAYGARVLDSMKVVAQTAATLQAKGIITEANAAQVMIIGNKAAADGQQLADLLAAYDAAGFEARVKMRVPLDAKIRSLVTAATTMSTTLKIAPGQQAEWNKWAAVVQKVLDAIAALRGAIPEISPVG